MTRAVGVVKRVNARIVDGLYAEAAHRRIEIGVDRGAPLPGDGQARRIGGEIGGPFDVLNAAREPAGQSEPAEQSTEQAAAPRCFQAAPPRNTFPLKASGVVTSQPSLE